MKKRIISLLLALVMCGSLVGTAYATESDADNKISTTPPSSKEFVYESHDVELSDENEYRFVDPALVTKSASKSASSSDYLYSYYTYVSHRITAHDSLPRTGDVFLLSVARGQTKTVSSTKRTSATISFSGTANADLKNAIAAKVGANASYAITVSVTSSQSFSFPDGYPGNSASFYLACGFDKYEFTYYRYDVYTGDGLGGGMGVGNHAVYAGTFTPSAHIPKKVVYVTTSTY